MGRTSESARERETFRYVSSLISNAVINDSTTPLPPTSLSTSADVALTAFAQLAAIRLGAERALISFFNRKYQYIVAEATQASPLTAGVGLQRPHDGLWLCGTTIPRAFGICEHVLHITQSPQWTASTEQDGSQTDLPVSTIPNLTEDARFSSRPYCKYAFYAGIPIRTRNDIDIGVVCVLGDKPRDEIDATSAQAMRDLSVAIMNHLENKRARDAYNRSQRMVRGVGSFVEGKATISGWAGPAGPAVSADSTDPAGAASLSDLDGKREGTLNANQQKKLPTDSAVDGAVSPDFESHRSQHSGDGATYVGPVTPIQNLPGLSTPSSHAPSQDINGSVGRTNPTPDARESDQTSRILSRAANILRESIEVEGMIFLDASVHSFGGLRNPGSSSTSDGTLSSSESQEDAGKSSQQPSTPPSASSVCRVLGFSTSDISSIDDIPNSSFQLTMPEKFLAKLLRQYPEGRIFNFDEDGYVQSRDSSGDEDAVQMREPGDIVVRQVSSQSSSRQGRRKQSDGSAIIKIFTGARSIALVPVWDPRRQRWFAGGFAFTKNPTRMFTVEGELSYLRAFGSVIMAEITRAETAVADGAKSVALSSISHELRSPLHGLLLGAELLSNSGLDAFQGNMLHTIETCGRTLLDTIDHLLDYSKINNFMRISKTRKAGAGARGLRQDKKRTIEAGMSSTSANVQLDLIVEEVIESLYFGHNFQRMSLAQMEKQMPAEHEDLYALRRLGSMDASMSTTGRTRPAKQAAAIPPLDTVSIRLDIDPKESWLFHTQPGAIRRILMNLFGNSLKYTKAGTIKVSVGQAAARGKRQDSVRIVSIVVQDTGKGISEDYLKNQLFRPFAQEDELAPGTGLGLSLVKQITSSLGGTIKVESRVGVGTEISIHIPMAQTVPRYPQGTAPSVDPEFADHVNQLAGLRVRLYGFRSRGTSDGPDSDGPTDDLKLMEKVCQDWLQMRVITEQEEDYFSPDLLLCTEDGFRELSAKKLTKQPPTVTICHDVLTARQLTASCNKNRRQGVFEFVSQPAGPRKLAKVLLLCFNDWVGLQSSPSGSKSTSSEDFNSVSTPPEVLGDGDGSEITAADFSWDDKLSEPVEPAPADIPPAEATETQISALPLTRPTTTLQLRTLPKTTEESTEEKYLLVDDNFINMKILTTYMSTLGHTCKTANNGKEAYEVYTQTAGHFDYIFMDISMPVMDGLEASRLIRTFERKQQLRPAVIIALTGLASVVAQQDAFASGINLFLTKPVRLKELTAILKRQHTKPQKKRKGRERQEQRPIDELLVET